MELLEKQRLSAYALVSNQKIYSSQADLDPKDHADPSLLFWCLHHFFDRVFNGI